MYIDRRHKYFVFALVLLGIIVVSEFVVPGLVWWQRWLFIYIPVGIAVELLSRYMGWWVPPPQDEWDAMTPEQREASRFKRH
jgi:hypothetical protein